MKLLALLLIFVSCAQLPVPAEKAPEVATEVLKPVEVAKPVEAPKPQPVEQPKPQKRRVRVMIASLTGFTPESEARFKKIAANVETLINSDEFQKGMLDFTYKGKKAFIDNKGDSNETVLANVLKSDWKLEYRLEYKRFGKTIGYTLPSVSWIVIYTKFWNSLDDAEIADNMLHEYGGHKLGRYDHDMNWNADRDYSVPYGMGYLGEKLYRKMFMK